MQTDDIAAWLTSIWDGQEKAARAALLAIASRLSGYDAEEPFEVLHDRDYLAYAFHVPPELVLARIAADRQILALHKPDREPDTWYWLERECKECGQRWHANTPAGTPPTVIGPETGCPTVRLLALPHADRPGYQESWRPARLP